ncbi:Uncharacterised protein [Rhodococcus rhodochrous]|uniref:hypothetical protein n=1 Tax=Rhodococcus TaxID=1827 RepID=UPI000751668D|nr:MULTISPECIES: hypothetical protein [Rhodococcus]MDC3727463.1 hypothetical protein [Rhodococcus sp. Rp3]MDO1486714.1 hypothetical protein [Rhodococcus rhodochrous]TWH37896.1 hypothetical protein L612_000700000030 [Rhodococcus rhodochrous J38]WSE21831.1 hypothetical protein U9J23_19505 [Rhodococcus sp. PD04]SNV24621.1 Uncharacterised protein [Rhodococcus rhodochrous]
MADEKIFVVDRVVTKPGCARTFVDRYIAEYVPGGRGRGMTLDRILVTPPVWSDDETNVVTIMWSVDGVNSWWNMTRQGRRDPELGRWWSDMDQYVTERSRTMAAQAADIEGLADV